jgi:16S rRNA (guanine527-N7)-methyltransferase
MDSPDIIFKYFPGISEKQKEQFSQLAKSYEEWNSKINVISRKDIDNFYERHVLHSLAIAKVISFKPRTKILDVGTGGGFPGIPLAILFPDCEFELVDSIGKKIRVVNAVAENLELKNVKGTWSRAEKIKDKYHFVISRAVTELSEFKKWVKGKFRSENFNDLQNGILYLRGEGTYELKNYFSEEFFKTKKLVYLPATTL